MLDDAALDAFGREGVAVVEGAVPAALRDAVEAEYRGLIDGLAARHGIAPRSGFLDTLRAVHEAGIEWFQPLDISLPGGPIAPDTPFHIGPAVRDLMVALAPLVEPIVGPEVTLNPIQHLRIKPPARTVAPGAPVHTARTAWHQDRGVAHAEADGTEMVTVWVAMTDATPENGCLRAIPFAGGRQAMLPHCPMDQTAIPDAHLDLPRAVDLPVRAGGVVLLHPMVPHGAGDNMSDGMRWSFDLRYQRTGEPTGRDWFPAFPVRGLGVAPPSWQEMRAAWEEARAAAALAPHRPIHRWTSDSPHCA